MKKVLMPMGALLFAGAFACAGHASAASSQHHMTSQQSRFAACAHKSKGLKGKAHTAFMRACLKGDEKEAARIKAAAKGKSDKKGGHGHA